jgi:uncharacterized linocin/CFP29 family protein
MNHLRRELAPISEEGWHEVEVEAARALRSFLAARKLVDVTGPLGWEYASVDLGSVQRVDDPPAAGVDTSVRQVAPLVELRTPFSLARSELDAIDRGSRSPDLEPVVEAARKAALAEDKIVFHGFDGAGIAGIASASPQKSIPIDDDYEEFPGAAARAVAALRQAGVDGPYGIALGPRCYTGVIETTQKGGYPVLEQLRLITGGPLAWAPAVDGSVVLSVRGGDFELTLGEDLSIGFVAADADRVQLFLEESLAFRAHTPEAAVALVYQS